MPTKVFSSLQLKYNVHKQYDDYNDHVTSLEYIIYDFTAVRCVLAAFCKLLLNG